MLIDRSVSTSFKLGSWSTLIMVNFGEFAYLVRLMKNILNIDILDLEICNASFKRLAIFYSRHWAVVEWVIIVAVISRDLCGRCSFMQLFLDFHIWDLNWRRIPLTMSRDQHDVNCCPELPFDKNLDSSRLFLGHLLDMAPLATANR